MRWVDDALAQILKRQLRAEPLEVDWQDPRLQLIDLAGDGFPDVLIDRGRDFVCYRSKGADGFDMPRVVRTHRDEPGKPVLMHADAHTPIQLADMTGDGLIGLVRIRIGEVCYWQNLGHAGFGPMILMRVLSRFAQRDLFDPARLRLADVDGSAIRTDNSCSIKMAQSCSPTPAKPALGR